MLLSNQHQTMASNFLKVVLSGFLFLVLAALIMLPVHFFTDYQVEWKISCFFLFLYGMVSPLLSYRFDNLKQYFIFSCITVIALFFDLSILAALVAWKPWSYIVYHLRFMFVSLGFFPLSWGIWYIIYRWRRK